MMRLTLFLVLAIVIVGCERPKATTPPAPSSQSSVTVSGLSSGAYMATQLHVAHSARISGVGLIAGGPYGCSEGSIQRALSVCTAGGTLDVPALLQRVETFQRDTLIDSVNNLEAARVWLFHGASDSVVGADVTAAAEQFYERFIPGVAQIKSVSDVAAAHGFPVTNGPVACDVMAPPFLNSCDYDAAGALLKHVIGDSGASQAADTAMGTLQAFEQPDVSGSGLAKTGFIYTPQQCSDNTQCHVHLALHGCSQGQEFVGEQFAQASGYNRWADALGVVVIYPQIAANPLLNPLGCWDWWGYTGAQFDTQRGTQIRGLIEIIDRHEQAAL
ncbi:MAG: PHB depolymerase family esterase [Pseudomonadota bacterium]